MHSDFRKFSCTFITIVFVTGCSVKGVSKHGSVPIEPDRTSFDNSIEQSQQLPSCRHTKTTLSCIRVVEVHDGDTIFIDIPGAPPPFAERMPVRVAGIDAPELSSKDACEKRKAQKAKLVLESLIHNAKRIDIVNVERDKFFRIDGTILADGQSVADQLLKDKLAYPYHGEGKVMIDWCRY